MLLDLDLLTTRQLADKLDEITRELEHYTSMIDRLKDDYNEITFELRRRIEALQEYNAALEARVFGRKEVA